MRYWLSVAGLTDVGRERELNEDLFYYRVVQSSDEGPLGLFVVADGMGGHLAGEVASQWAVSTLKRELAPLFRPQDPSVTRRLDAEALAAVAWRGASAHAHRYRFPSAAYAGRNRARHSRQLAGNGE